MLCEVTASWSKCADPDFKAYLLYRSTAPGIEEYPDIAELLTEIDADTVTSFRDAGAKWDTEYYYALQTRNAKGYSSWSNEAAITTPNNGPTASKLYIGPVGLTTCDIRWSRCRDNDFQSYTLFRSNTFGIEQDTSAAEALYSTTSDSDTAFFDSELLWGHRYFYALRTMNDNMLYNWSNEEGATTDEPVPLTEVASVLVGGGAEGVCVVPSADKVYVAINALGGEVKSISTPDHTLLGSIQVGDAPFGVCGLPDGTHVYVTNKDSDDVYVIRCSDDSVSDVISVGDQPRGLCASPSGDRVYVANYAGGSVSVIRTSDNTVVATVPSLSSPWGTCCLPSGEYLYVACSGNGSVAVIRTSDNLLVDEIAVGNYPVGICSSGSGDRIYVSCWGSDNVYAIDTQSNTVVDVVEVGDGPGGICYHPYPVLYVACERDDAVMTIEAAEGKVVGSTATDRGAWGVCCDQGGDYVYVTNSMGGTLSVLGYEAGSDVDKVLRFDFGLTE
jgi:YVTN family beta-propeller protein